MEFSIGRLRVEIELTEVSPFQMSKRAKRRLAKRILAEGGESWANLKIQRIKTFRLIAKEEGWSETFNFGLKSCKDWVEEVFADNGAGEIAL